MGKKKKNKIVGPKRKGRNRKGKLESGKKKLIESFDYDSDEIFAFIAGYTDGGIPFGVTYEELEENNDFDFFESFYNENKFNDKEEWAEPSDEKWIESLLNQKQTTPIKWENEHWYSDSFDWEKYFGHFPSTENQEQLVYELNRLDLLKTILGTRERL